MFKKIFITIFIFIVITSCGYSPVYKGFKNIDFAVAVDEVKGDRDIGNLIKSNLNRYSSSPGDKIFSVKVFTRYSKNSIAKDTTGNTTDYRLKVESTFQIQTDELIKKINITETFDMKSKTNKFEELESETILKENISNTIVNKLLTLLTRLR